MKETATRSRLARDIAIAIGLMVVSAALVFLTPAAMSRDTSMRIFGILLGAFVIFCANEGPKALPPLDRVRDPVAEQARRRFGGWAITLGGVAYLVTWLIAPVNDAPPIAAALLALSVAAAIGRCLLGRRRDPSTSIPDRP